MPEGSQHIVRFMWMWRGIRIIESFLIATGAGCGLWWYTGQLIPAVSAFVIAFTLYLFLVRPWRITSYISASYLDQHLAHTEYSAGLLLHSPEELSGVAQLQRRKIVRKLEKSRLFQQLPVRGLPVAFLVMIICMAAGYWMPETRQSPEPPAEAVVLHSTGEPGEVPEITSFRITRIFPAYTGLPSEVQEDMSVEALAGSRIIWQVTLSGPVDSLYFVSEDNMTALFTPGEGDQYSFSLTPGRNLLYSLRLTRDTLTAVSDVNYVRLLPDRAPEVHPVEMAAYVEFPADTRNPSLPVTADITDDYGLTDVRVVATLTRGSGESVQFREEIIRFDNEVRGLAGRVSRNLWLDSLGMVPGDELYFYIEATDNKVPEPGRGRSETFFVAIEDTISQEFMTGSAMAVDLMPDYFRSQRQLIIDTEALLKKKARLAVQAFREESNALGYDQKLLRLKYGQYMGDEFDSGITGPSVTPDETGEEANEEDPLAAYTHDHDHEEEGPLAVAEEEEEEDPLEAFFHEHSDPEEATLYTQGVRSMLKQAMAEMWDAELQLRLYDPEKSLPYQYRALDLIQKIKNQARIYVHRIGFDPPPIKEDARLTGELGEVRRTRQRTSGGMQDPYEPVRALIRLLEENKSVPPQEARFQEVLQEAGSALLPFAEEEPLKYLGVLSRLRQMQLALPENSEWENDRRKLLSGLNTIMPPGQVLPGSVKPVFWSELDSIYQRKVEGRMPGD